MSDYSELKRLAEAAQDFSDSGVEPGTFNPYEYQFIAAANPAAVLALIAEWEGWNRACEAMCALFLDAEEKRDQLKAEVKALRKALITIRQESHDIGACECAADALVDSRKASTK